MILNVINGDAAAADVAAALGKVQMLVWRDVLHEGPVPAVVPEELVPIRAAFLAGQGWADGDEARIALGKRDAQIAALEPSDKVVLWFEDDVYDQLQLIQVLDRLTEHNGPIDLMALPREGRTPLLVRHARARALGEPELALARHAWAAFTAPDPHALQDLWLAGTPSCPTSARRSDGCSRSCRRRPTACRAPSASCWRGCRRRWSSWWRATAATSRARSRPTP